MCGHFVMQIRPLKPQSFAWEPGLSDSAYLNYAKKSGSQLVPKNASSIHNFPQIPLVYMYDIVIWFRLKYFGKKEIKMY